MRTPTTHTDLIYTIPVRDPNTLPLPELFDALASDANVHALLTLALREDLSEAGDITSDSIINPQSTRRAWIVARQPGVISGLAVLPQLVERIATRYQNFQHIDLKLQKTDGERCTTGDTLAELTGNLRTILALERTALNLIGRMSGVATLTAQYVDAVRGTKAVICDTRKTMPGMRALDKYAVRCGGGTLHRIGLYDAALYKDNHLAGVPIEKLRNVITTAALVARKMHNVQFVEVEVDSLAQFEQLLAIEHGVIDIVLLDNFNNDNLRQAVAMRNERAPHLELEASGGVTLKTVRAIAETGVDRISVGALTHSSPHLDVALDMQ